MVMRQVNWYGCRDRSSRSVSQSQIIFIWPVYHCWGTASKRQNSSFPLENGLQPPHLQIHPTACVCTGLYGSVNEGVCICVHTLHVCMCKFVRVLFRHRKCIIGGSCHKYHFCHDKHIFVMKNTCLSQQKTCFVVINMFVTTKVCLSQQNFCHNKNFVTTSILLSQ